MSKRGCSHSGGRFGENSSFLFPPSSSSPHKIHTPSLLPIFAFVTLLVGLSMVAYFYTVLSGAFVYREAVSTDGGLSCSAEVGRSMPFLRKAYAGKMHKVLHVGPDSCRVVRKLSKEGDTEAWGIEPYDLDWGDDADSNSDTSGSCMTLIYRGIVRVADIKFPLPYRPNSFSLVIVSDAMDYLSIKYLNKTLPDLARLSVGGGGLVLFSGYPGQQRLEVLEVTKLKAKPKLRSWSWWMRLFTDSKLEENQEAVKLFNQAVTQALYKPTCQIFHLRSFD